MKIILFSILAVVMIGLMVPSAFAEVHIVDIFLGEESDECPVGYCMSNKNLEVEANDIVILQHTAYPEMELMAWEGGTPDNGPYDKPLPMSTDMFDTLDGKEVRAFQFIDSTVPQTTTTTEYDDYLTEVDIRVWYGNEGKFNYFCMIHPWIAGSIKVNSFVENLNKIQNSHFDVNKNENGIFEFEVTGIAPSNAELTLELSVPEYEILSYVRDGINFTFKGTLDVTNPYHYTANVCAPELTQGGDSTRMLCDSAPFHFGQEPKAKDWFPDIIFRGAITGGVGNGFSYNNGETIEIAGTIENAVPDRPLTITIYNPMQKIAVSKDVTIDSDGKFSTSIIAAGGGFQASGTYSVFFSHSYMRQPSPSQFNFDATAFAPTTIKCQQSESYLNVKNSRPNIPTEFKDFTYSLSSLDRVVDELKLGRTVYVADMNNCQDPKLPIFSPIVVTASFSSTNTPWKEAPLNIMITSVSIDVPPPGSTYDFNTEIIQNGKSVFKEDFEKTFVCTPGCFPQIVKTTPVDPTSPLDINITFPNSKTGFRDITLNLHLASQATKPQTSEPVIEEKQVTKSKQVLSFVDQNKDPSHYVKRYITESSYKEWFDSQFPNYTIWEGIGISQQQYQNIVDDLTKPVEPIVMETEPEAEPEAEPTSAPAPIETKSESKGGGCLIATAAYGSEMAPQVQFLREIRDNTVLQTQSGTSFMTVFNQFYYSFSPTIADYERENPVFKEAVKVGLTPLLTSLTILNYIDIDTEQEMLGYGIGIIMLNIGMYFVAPAVMIIAIKKRFKA